MNSIQKYVKGCFSELKNVTWPTKKQAQHDSAVVLTTMLLVALFLSFLDAGFGEIVSKFILNIG